MVIIGIDPGLARTGFGIIDPTQSSPYIQCGCLTTPAHESLPARLAELAQDLGKILRAAKPHLAVVERVFFGTNKKTAMQISEARGVILHTLHQHHVAIEELTPLQIKSRLVGYGQATKEQVQSLVTQRLSLNRPPQPDDAADALAAALCATDPSFTKLPYAL